MADILLTCARLFRDRNALAEARDLIEQCGYWRRKEELEDAEATLPTSNTKGEIMDSCINASVLFHSAKYFAKLLAGGVETLPLNEYWPVYKHFEAALKHADKELPNAAAGRGRRSAGPRANLH